MGQNRKKMVLYVDEANSCSALKHKYNSDSQRGKGRINSESRKMGELSTGHDETRQDNPAKSLCFGGLGKIRLHG